MILGESDAAQEHASLKTDLINTKAGNAMVSEQIEQINQLRKQAQDDIPSVQT